MFVARILVYIGGILREGKGGEASGSFHDLASWFLM